LRSLADYLVTAESKPNWSRCDDSLSSTNTNQSFERFIPVPTAPCQMRDEWDGLYRIFASKSIHCADPDRIINLELLAVENSPLPGCREGFNGTE
jgi:hypothetical protein